MAESRVTKYRSLMLVLAVVFATATAVYSVAWMYYVRSQVQVEVGMDTDSVPAGLKVKDVWHASPAEKAGLRPDDIIIAINDRSLATPASGMQVLDRIWLAGHPGQTVALTIQRKGVPQPSLVTPVFRKMQGTGDTVSLARRGALRLLQLYPLLFLVVGLAVLFLRPEDRYAWLLAFLFAALITAADLPRAFASAPEGLRQFLYGFRTLGNSVLPGLFYWFFAVFPTRSPIDRKIPWLKHLLVATGLCLGLGGFRNGGFDALPFIDGLLGRDTVDLTRTITGYGSVLLGLTSLFWNFVSVASVEARRKLTVILWGTVVGITPAILIGIPYDLAHTDVPFWLGFVRGTCLFLLPLSFAYAVVKHRVMAIPVLLRRSARYLLVERGFAILILIFSIGITLWFGQAYARRFAMGSKAAIPIGATFGVLLISGAIQVHRQVRTRLDRAFFRSAYDSQQILENLAETALTVSDRPSLAALLHQHTHQALHPMPLVIYLLSAGGELKAYAGAAPEEESTLSANDGALRQLGERNEPVETDPEASRGTALERLRPECLVPIGGPPIPSGTTSEQMGSRNGH